MDGYIAKLDRICDLAEQHDALVMVDDSHAVGFVGRDRPRHARALRRHRARRHPHRHARQGDRRRERRLRRPAGARSSSCCASARGPYLFSNSLAPPVVAASLRALELIESSDELRDRLRENTARFRARMTELGFDVLPGEHPIVPVMIGDEVAAARFSEELVALGVYAVSFSFPVVPRGHRADPDADVGRAQPADLDFAVDAFVAARDATE